MQLFDALKYGTIGLCAVLMYLAYLLLGKEQQASKPRSEIINLIRLFMFLAVGSMAIGLCSQLPVFRPEPSHSSDAVQWSSGFGPDFFTGNWDVTDAHDVQTPAFTFTPRYQYSGTLQGHVEGGEFVLSGQLHSLDGADPRHQWREAAFSVSGPINNNEVAGHFTYSRSDVNGFGTAFLKFDASGNADVYMIVRVTKPHPGDGDVAMVVMHLQRLAK